MPSLDTSSLSRVQEFEAAISIDDQTRAGVMRDGQSSHARDTMPFADATRRISGMDASGAMRSR